MKKLICVIFSCVLISFCFCLNALALGDFTAYNCSGYQDGNTLHITWAKFENASSYELTYTVKTSSSSRTVKINLHDTNYVIDNLTFGCKVDIAVNAFVNDSVLEVFSGLELTVLYAPPVILEKGENSVELKRYMGMTYSMDGVHFFNESLFSGLEANTEYTFYQKDSLGNISNPLTVMMGKNEETTNQTSVEETIQTLPAETTVETVETTNLPQTQTEVTQKVDPRTKNTKTTVYGEGISIIDNSGKYNASYFIKYNDLTDSVSSGKDYSTIVSHAKKAIGKQYGDILKIYSISFGYTDSDGDDVYIDLPYNGIISMDISDIKCDPVYLCFDYEKEAQKLVTSVKDGVIKTVINVDTNYKYIVLVGDKDGIKNSGIVNTKSSGTKPQTNITFSLDVLPYIAIAVVAVAVGVVLMLIFIKKIRNNQSREWLKNNKRF